MSPCFCRPYTLSPISYTLFLCRLSGGQKLGLALGNRLIHLGAEGIAELALFLDLLKDAWISPLDGFVQHSLKLQDCVNRKLVQMAGRPCIDNEDLSFDLEGDILSLFQHLDHSRAPIELGLGRLVQFAPKLGERGHLPILRQVQPEFTGHLPHRLDLGRAADPGDRQTDVDGRPDTGEEQIGFQVNLAIGNRDHVGRDVGRDVAKLGLDDWERSQRPPAQIVIQLGPPLQKARVQVEDIARIGLTAGRPTQQERELAIGLGMLGQVVVDAQGVTTGVSEILAYRAAGIGGDILERRQFGGSSRNNRSVGHSPGLFQRLDHLGDGGPLLTDRHIDTEDVFTLLVDNGVDGDCRLAGLPVADDQLALSPSDRNHGIDGLDASLKRLLNRSAVYHPGGQPLNGPKLFSVDRSLAVDRQAQSVYHSPYQRLAHRHRGDPARPLDQITLLDRFSLAQQDRADVILLKVQHHAEDVVRKLQKLAGHGLLQAVDTSNPVARLDDGADLRDINKRLVPGQLLLDNFGDLFRFDLRHSATLSVSAILALQQVFAYLFQLCPYGPIVDGAADLRNKPAHDGGVDLGLQIDLFSRRRPQALLEPVNDRLG